VQRAHHEVAGEDALHLAEEEASHHGGEVETEDEVVSYPAVGEEIVEGADFHQEGHHEVVREALVVEEEGSSDDDMICILMLSTAGVWRFGRNGQSREPDPVTQTV